MLTDIEKTLVVEKLQDTFKGAVRFGHDRNGIYYETSFGVSISNKYEFALKCNLIATEVAGAPTIIFPCT